MKKNEFVEVKSINPEMSLYTKWAKISRFLAIGLQGVKIREVDQYIHD